jgi:hypothetical protein
VDTEVTIILAQCPKTINGKCFCCGGDKIINRGTPVEEPCPFCQNERK